MHSKNRRNKIAKNINEEFFGQLTIGQKVADKVAQFGGSWPFIIIFFFVLLVWVGVNVSLFRNKGFDPYPFILLNLFLSMLAAIQAPIIMMSQNRQSHKDRLMADYDYQLNKKAEEEIEELHKKLDILNDSINDLGQLLKDSSK